MTHPLRFLVFVSAALAFAAPAFAKGLPVKSVSLDTTTDAYEVSVKYPQTGLAAIDDDIAAWAKKTSDDFIKEATADRQPDESPYALDVSYEVRRNDGAGFGVLFSEEYDTGGAHPNHDFETFNYLMPDGWRVYLPELFTKKALARISAFAIKDLTNQLAGPDGSVDTDTIDDGTGRIGAISRPSSSSRPSSRSVSRPTRSRPMPRVRRRATFRSRRSPALPARTRARRRLPSTVPPPQRGSRR